MKFCQFVVSLCLHIFTNFGRFILIFNKMALIFLWVPIVFNVFSFQVSLSQISITSSPIMNGPQFIRPQFSWTVRLGGNAGVLLQAAARNSSQVYRCTLADLVCLAGERHWQRCERQPQLTAGMWVSQWWRFWTCNVTVRITDTNCYI